MVAGTCSVVVVQSGVISRVKRDELNQQESG